MSPVALISVYDKTGLAEFARALNQAGISLVSTGGTYTLLSTSACLPVQKVSDLTGFPRDFGRTRQRPFILRFTGVFWRGGITRRTCPNWPATNIDFIDVVVSNLYPFQETISQPNVTLDEALENIDIAGPTLLRAAAKNFPSVTVCF